MEIKIDMLEKLDAALTECLNDPGQIDAEALIRFCYPVIQKHRNAGLKIESVAVILQGMGYKVTKGHLVRHLGKIMREQAAVKAACPESEKETATPAARVKGGVKDSGLSQPAVAVSVNTAVLSMDMPEQVDISVPESNTSSGWELENRDDLIPAGLLKLAFVEIAGKTYDVRQPMPREFGESREISRDKVKPGSLNWDEYAQREDWRTAFEQAMRMKWRPLFRKWLIEQGYTGIRD